MRTSLIILGLFLPGWIAANPAAPVPCHPVSSDSVTASDLAQAIPEFSQLGADLTFGFAPTPGVERQFSIYELQRIAKQHNIRASIQAKVCFAWPVQSLEKKRIIAAMEASLNGRQSTIEILDQDRAPVPAGEIVFPLQGLSALSDKPVIWKGYVAFSPSRRFSTWALAHVRVRDQHLVAVRTIHLGEPILLEHFKSERYEGPLLREETVSDIAQGAEFHASRNILVGTTLLSSMLSVPVDVQRGDPVTVMVDSGSAHVEAPGIATQAGSIGDIVLVKNPRSGSLFKARVVSKGRVLVIPGILSGLVGREDKS